MNVTLQPALSMRIPQSVLNAGHRIADEGKAVLAPAAVADAAKQVGAGVVNGDLNAIKAGAKAALPSLGKAAGNGAIFSGVISLVSNAFKVFKKEETVAQAGGLVVADTAIGAVGGFAAASASGIGMAALGAIGLAGLPLTLAGAAIGCFGFWAIDHIAKDTGLYKTLSDKISQKLQTMPAAQQLQAAVN